MLTKKYSKIVFIANILIFSLLLLFCCGCIFSIKVFAASVSSTNLATSPVNTATPDSISFFSSEAISKIMSPVISVVSISFAMSTYLLNNSYNINNMSISTNTRKLLLKQSKRTSALATVLLIMLVPLLITNIVKCYIGFYVSLGTIIILLFYLVHKFIQYNCERNIIANFNKNFKESKIQRRRKKDTNNKAKKGEKNSDYIFANIEICYENKYQGMFSSYFIQVLDFWCEYIDTKKNQNLKIEEKFESFYITLDEIFNNKQLDSKYLSNLYVYFLAELEKVIFENADKFKNSNYEIIYSACLSYAFNSIFDVRIIDEFFKSETCETFIYRWLFYRYILLFEYNKFIKDTNFFKPRFSFSEELGLRVKSISICIKDNHIMFLILSLFLYKNRCLKGVNLIFDMNYILDTMKEDLINFDSIIKNYKVKR